MQPVQGAQKRPMPVPEPGQRWGILGGTFDPVHNGHLTLARQVAQLEALAGVLLIPAHTHPFKGGPLLADYGHRLRMLELAIENDNDLLICEIEKEESLPGYTLDTIRALKKRFRGIEFYFIIGLDNLNRIAEWRSPAEILDEVHLLVGSRPGSDWQLPLDLPHNRIRYVHSDEVRVSSTEIREAVRLGQPASFLASLVPERVLRYINENGLYQ